MNEEISKTYSLDEIAKHNNRDDLWIIVKGKVYDVTTYLPLHQGGDAILKCEKLVLKTLGRTGFVDILCSKVLINLFIYLLASFWQ